MKNPSTKSRPVSQTLIGFLTSRDGWVSGWSLFFITALLMMGGLSVDYSNGIMTRAKLQAASDAASLAASLELPDTAAATAAGMEIANLHFDATDGNAIQASDFVYGWWNEDTELLEVGGTPINGVSVVANRSQSNNNALPTILLGFIGMNSFDVVAGSVAVAYSDVSCRNGGFFTEMEIISGSNNDYLDGFCLYGHDGVKIGSDNTFETGVFIEMENDSNLDQGGNNSGVDDALREATHTLTLPGLVPTIVSSMEASSFDYMPDFITSVQSISGDFVPENAGDHVSGRLYIVEDVADLSKVSYVNNVAVVAGKEVKIGSDQTIYNVVFATMDKVLIGSNNTFEHPDACNYGRYSAYLFSGVNIEFGSNNLLTGVQMGAVDEIKLGSDVAGIKDVYAEAGGNFDYGSADTFAGCPDGLATDIGPGPGKVSPNYVAFGLVR